MIPYRADIDGLRAVAVAMVLIFHFDLLPSVNGGFTGVDVFFVISGFLITSIVSRQIEGNTFNLSEFYLGRIRRLAPALLVVLVATMIGGWIYLLPNELVQLSREVVASQLYVANIYFWRNVNYFGLQADHAFLLHTWSLSVEEQFYLIFPLAYVALITRFRKWTLPIVLSPIALSFALNIALVSTKPEATFYLLPTRAWEFLVGTLVAIVSNRLSSRSSEALALLGLAGIVCSLTLYTKAIAFPGSFALLAALGTAAIIASGPSTTVSSVLGSSWFTYIGRISYPLYLAHWPINTFASQIYGRDYTIQVRLFMLLLSVMAAVVIYHGVERPVRSAAQLTIKLGASYAGFVIVTTIIAVVLIAGAGFPNRFSPETNHLASFVNDRSPPLSECQSADNLTCRIGASVEPTWIVVGDSHAWAAHAAFDLWLKERGEAALFAFQHSCPPLIGIHLAGDIRDQCFRFNSRVFEEVAKAPAIDKVLLVSIWRQGIEGLVTNSRARMLDNEESRAVFRQQLAATVSFLNTIGKKVYIFEPVPGARASVPIALARHRQAPEISGREYEETYADLFDVIKHHRNAIAGTFSSSKVLCSVSRCRSTLDGEPLYFDNNHMTRSSAHFWAEMLRKQIPAP